MFDLGGGHIFTFPSRKKKLSEEERLIRCRERNRIHAKNTRERKKERSELLEMQINQLKAATMQLRQETSNDEYPTTVIENSLEPLDYLQTLKRRKPTEDTLSSNDELATNNHPLVFSENSRFSMVQKKDAHTRTPEEIEMLRRERNRIHAKKTRMRKKKVLADMQQVTLRLR